MTVILYFFINEPQGGKEKKSIRMLKADEGNEHVGDKVVGHVVVCYFKHIFESSHPTMKTEALDHLMLVLLMI